MKVVIVGAGLTGAYTAYLLAQAGVQVVSIDPLDTPGHASDVNPGGLNPLHGPGIPGPVSAFALRCHELHKREWNSVQSLSAIDFQPRLVTRLILALSSDELKALDATADMYRATQGFDASQLKSESLRELRQGISPTAT
jgi:glycine/D-amino acid oxidase-like deaminating enzyme